MRDSGAELGRIRLALTCGEPAGIGAEVALKALGSGLPPGVEPLLVGPRAVWEAAAVLAGLDALPAQVLEPSACAPTDWAWAKPTALSGRVAAEAVETAARLCLEGRLDGMVTAPLTKEGLLAAGRPYPGHTELLEALCREAGSEARATMMLAGDRLKVLLVTTHVPLARVSSLVTKQSVIRTIQAAHLGLRGDCGVPNPRIGVAGLNPHAGEGGVLGDEDREVVGPAVEEASRQGISVRGPIAADSLFLRAYEGEFDAAIALYHDQGLPALKLVHFWDGVNVTLGLPLVRTSPDHGTAFGLAGKGAARSDSFGAAVRWAAQIAARRRIQPPTGLLGPQADRPGS